jgi:DNA polymerase IIIc chi subunit
VLGEWIRTHARTFLHSRAKHATVDPESHQSQIKHLDTILGTLTPSHFMPEHLMKEGQQPVKHVEISDKKLDSIDRFTMVKSRIV